MGSYRKSKSNGNAASIFGAAAIPRCKRAGTEPGRATGSMTGCARVFAVRDGENESLAAYGLPDGPGDGLGDGLSGMSTLTM